MVAQALAPKLEARVRARDGRILAKSAQRRGFDLGEPVKEMLGRLPHDESVRDVTVECWADAGVPELRLEHAALERISQLKAGIQIESSRPADGPQARPQPDGELELLFSIDGQFDPTEATRRIGITPDHAHNGDVRKVSAHRGVAWDLKWGPGDPAQLDALLSALITTLGPRAADIRAFCRERGVAATVHFVRYSASLQRFRVDAEQIHQIVRLGAGIWYAPYVRSV